MNDYSILPLFSAMLFLFCGLQLLFLKKFSKQTITFFMLCIVTFGWQFAWFLLFNFQSIANFLVKVGYSSIIFIPIIYNHFIASMLPQKRVNRQIAISYLIGCFFLFSLWATPWFINGYYTLFWGPYPKASFLHPVYLTFLSLLVGKIIFEISFHLRTTNRHNPNFQKYKYLLISVIVYTFASLDFLINYGLVFYPIGVLFILTSMSILLYALFAYNLMDIPLIIKNSLITIFLILLWLIPALIYQLIADHFLKGFYSKVIVLSFTIVPFLYLSGQMKLRAELTLEHFLNKKRFEYQQAIKEISDRIVNIYDLKKLMEYLAETLCKTLEIKKAVLFLETNRSFLITAEKGISENERALYNFKENDTLIKTLQSHSGPILIDLSNQDQKKLLNNIHMQAVLPFIFKSKLLGFCLAGGRDFEYHYKKEDLDILKTLSNQIAIAIQTALSFKEIQDLTASLDQKVRDRTIELRDALSKLHEAHSKLQELDRLKTQFFANISHELRTPLTLILAPVETLMKGGFGPLESRQIKTLEVIRDNALRLLRLIGHLLDLIKIDAQEFNLHKIQVEIKSYLNSILNSIAPLAQQKKITLESDIPSSIEFVFDRNEMEKVLINLIYNAIKFTPPGGQIKIKVERKQDGLTIVVQDTGIGIPPEMREKIFDRFAQATSGTTRKFEGTGIGLALCKEIIKLHKGTISVQSELGKGSSFTVWIPVEKANPTAPEDPVQQKGNEWLADIHKAALISGGDLQLERDRFSSPVQSPVSPPKKSLLLVEDNPDLLSFLASGLQTEYQSFLARNGKEALQILSKNKPDLIVTDIMMPEMDGQELCRNVKANPSLKNIPFIFLSAKASLDIKLEGYELGADDYIVKPFNIEELRAKIKSLLSLKIMREALQQKNTELEKALIELKKVKDEKLAYIGEMAASLAHEIRNPLQPIRTYIEVLDENKNKPDFITRMINAILPSLDRMEFLISQLMSLGKTEHLTFTPQDPHRILQETLNILEPKLKIKNINVIKTFTAGSELLQADRNHLSQVFFNLIRNAFEAMGSNGILEIKTETALKNNQPFFRIAFKDNGSGMDAETLKRVFEPFFTTKKEKGTGLGLSISKQIIEAHGGTIAVQSKFHEGSTFTIELPVNNHPSD